MVGCGICRLLASASKDAESLLFEQLFNSCLSGFPVHPDPVMYEFARAVHKQGWKHVCIDIVVFIIFFVFVFLVRSVLIV